MAEEELKDFYEHRSLAKYPTSDNPENDAVVRKSLAALQLRSGQRLLDFGCSDGYFIDRLKRAVPEVDAHAIDLVHHDAWNSIDGVQFRAQDLPLPYPDGYFDAIFSSQVLEHLPDPASAAAELSRVLKPNGRMWIATPNGYNDTWKGFHSLQHYIDEVEGHFRHFSADDFRKLFEPYGCDVIAVNYDVFFGLYLYYRFIAYNPAVKRRLLGVVAPELVAQSCGTGRNAPAANAKPSLPKRFAFGMLRLLRAFDERFAGSPRCQIIEVTLVKRSG